MERIRGVILDVDGTLVDSNDAHARSWVEIFTRNGHTAGYEQVRRLIGKGGDKLVPEVTGLDAEHGEGKRLSDQRKALFTQQYLPYLEPFPRVRELLERMQRDGLRLVVASSAAKQELDPLLEAAGVRDLIEDRTSADDAEESKPDPDIVQAALRRSGLRPDQAVMLGDTPYDVEAAAKAGVRTIALRCGGWDDEALDAALAVYDDPADLLAHYEQSPLVHAGQQDRDTTEPKRKGHTAT
jgi:HAD superfamily hydrolase (TIGR01509 family)